MTSGRDERLFRLLREKVLQWAKDWKLPYSAGRAPDAHDAVMMISRKAAGHDNSGWPISAEAVKLWKKEEKYAASRKIFLREVYALSVHQPALYGALVNVFFYDAAGDADYEHLQQKAAAGYEESTNLLRAVEEALDWITRRLVEQGFTDRDFWARFGLRSLPARRSATKEEHYRTYYLFFEQEVERQRRDNPHRTRHRNQALAATAAEFGVAKRTVEEAVAQMESGYIEPED